MERGKIIKELRENVGMTQEDLAFETDMEQSNISMYENGLRNPTWERFTRILDAMGYELVVREKI